MFPLDLVPNIRVISGLAYTQLISNIIKSLSSVDQLIDTNYIIFTVNCSIYMIGKLGTLQLGNRSLFHIGCLNFICFWSRGFLIQESDTANQFRGVIQVEHRVLAEIGELLYEPLANQRIAVAVEIGSEVLHALVLLLVGCSIGDAGQELFHTIVGQVFELVVVVFFATLGLVLGGSAVGLAFDFQVGEILLQTGQDFVFLGVFNVSVRDTVPYVLFWRRN